VPRLPGSSLGTRHQTWPAVTGLLPDDESRAHRRSAVGGLLNGKCLPARSREILAILEHATEPDGTCVAESLLFLPGGGDGGRQGDGLCGEQPGAGRHGGTRRGLRMVECARTLRPSDRRADPRYGMVATTLDSEDWLAGLLDRRESEQDLAVIRRATYTGRPLGSKEFVAGLEARLGRILELRPGGRTRKIADCANQLEFWNAG